MIVKCFSLCLLVLAGMGAPLFSQTEDIITSLRVTGLKRTAPRVAEEPLRRFIGQQASTLNLDKVKAAVMDQGILELLSVTLEDDSERHGKTLAAAVKEKWTLFVGPFFFTGTGGMSAGLFLYNANTLGLNHKMIAGGLYDNDDWRFMLMYMVPSGSLRRFGWLVNAVFSTGEQRHADARNETLRRFNARVLSAGVIPQYQITNVMTAALRVSYTNITMLDAENPVNAPDAGTQFVQLGPELSVRRANWDGYLLSEENITVQYRFSQSFEALGWHAVSLKGIYEKSLIPGFRLIMRGGVLFRPEVPALFERDGELPVALFPAPFSTRHHAGLSLGLEKYLFRFSTGTISLSGAWQTAYTNSPLLGGRFDYGVLASLRFYLNRLAIPAVGLGVTYNIPAGYFQFAFSIGMTM